MTDLKYYFYSAAALLLFVFASVSEAGFTTERPLSTDTGSSGFEVTKDNFVHIYRIYGDPDDTLTYPGTYAHDNGAGKFLNGMDISDSLNNYIKGPFMNSSSSGTTAISTITPTQGDMFISYGDNALYSYDGSAWAALSSTGAVSSVTGIIAWNVASQGYAAGKVKFQTGTRAEDTTADYTTLTQTESWTLPDAHLTWETSTSGWVTPTLNNVMVTGITRSVYIPLVTLHNKYPGVYEIQDLGVSSITVPVITFETKTTQIWHERQRVLFDVPIPRDFDISTANTAEAPYFPVTLVSRWQPTTAVSVASWFKTCLSCIGFDDSTITGATVGDMTETHYMGASVTAGKAFSVTTTISVTSNTGTTGGIDFISNGGTIQCEFGRSPAPSLEEGDNEYGRDNYGHSIRLMNLKLNGKTKTPGS